MDRAGTHPRDRELIPFEYANGFRCVTLSNRPDGDPPCQRGIRTQVNSANAMPCTNEQIQTFKHSGYLVIENLIEPDTLLVHGASINVRAEPRFGMFVKFKHRHQEKIKTEIPEDLWKYWGI